MSDKSQVAELQTKRFVLRKSLIGKNQIISFTNKEGENYKYNHDEAWSVVGENISKLPCWERYGNYTATLRPPVKVREICEITKPTKK